MVSTKCSLCEHRLSVIPSRYYSEGFVAICGTCRRQSPPKDFRCTSENANNERCGQWIASEFRGEKMCKHHGEVNKK